MRWLLAIVGLAFAGTPAIAQTPVASEGFVVSACGTASVTVPAAATLYPFTVDGLGLLCVNTFSGAAATSIGKAEDAAAVSADVGVPALAVQTASPADAATAADWAWLQMSEGALWTRRLDDRGFVITSSITRIADHAAYSIADAISDSTTVPTTGGFTFSGACRASGGTGVITDIIITDSDDAATLLQPTLFIYNTAVTAINDNAAFAVTDAEARTMVAKVIGTILLDDGAQDDLALTNLNINYNCVGSANLRWLLRADNAYDPAANSGVIQVTIKGKWTN